MSFTPDELQSFNTILEQRLDLQRRELERTLEQRLHTLTREFEQRLLAVQQEMMRTLPQRIVEQQHRSREMPDQKTDLEQSRQIQELSQKMEDLQLQQQQHLEGLIENGLAAQRLAVEQMANQRVALQPSELVPTSTDVIHAPIDFGALEIQADIPWEELADAVEKALDERLSALNESIRASIKTMEQYLITQLQHLHADLVHRPLPSFNGNGVNLQEIFASITQLERVIESMQVAMTANQALLSNRLYHHQHLPFERAHPANHVSETVNSDHDNHQLPLPNDEQDE